MTIRTDFHDDPSLTEYQKAYIQRRIDQINAEGYPKPPRVSDEDIEAAIGTLENAGIMIVRRDDTGHVRWFTLRTTYGDDDLRKIND